MLTVPNFPAKLEARKRYAVEFFLRNPSEFQSGPSILIRTSGVTSEQIKIETPAPGNVRNALSIAGFYLHSRIEQSNPAQNGTNKISLSLIPQLTHPVAPRIELLNKGEFYAPGDARIFRNGVAVSDYNASFTTLASGSIDQLFIRAFGDNLTSLTDAEVRLFLPGGQVMQEERVGYIEILEPGSGHTDGTFQLIIGCNSPCAGTFLKQVSRAYVI